MLYVLKNATYPWRVGFLKCNLEALGECGNVWELTFQVTL